MHKLSDAAPRISSRTLIICSMLVALGLGCGDIVIPDNDNGTSTKSDATAETTTETSGTDSTSPSGELLCEELPGCADHECQGTDPASFDQCFRSALVDVCMPKALSNTEVSYFDSFDKCIRGCDNAADPSKCHRIQCADEAADCRSAGNYGTGGCAALEACVSACYPDTAACRRTCNNKATRDAAIKAAQWDMCIDQYCGEKSDPVGCHEQVRSGQDTACQFEANACGN